MGLLDALIRRGKREVTKMAVNALVDEISKSAQNKNESAATNANTAPAPKAVVNKEPEYEDLMADEKLRKILAEEFPQYEIREKVSPETLGGTGKFRPYDFGVYENGVPKLFIMVVSNNTCAQRLYRWSKEEAARAGVPMINFVYAFENKMDYVKNRLHQYL